MRTFITVTRKGQTTLPASIRHKLGLGSIGGRLRIHYREREQQLVISPAPSLEEISERLSRGIKPGTKPLLDVDAYYQQHRRRPMTVPRSRR